MSTILQKFNFNLIKHTCLYQVMGLRRQRNYAGRWDILIQQATQCLNRLIQIAARKKRNYILDQVLLYLPSFALSSQLKPFPFLLNPPPKKKHIHCCSLMHMFINALLFSL